MVRIHGGTRERAAAEWGAMHETDGATFLEAFTDAPLNHAFDKSLRYRAESQRDTAAATALMELLRDFRAGKAQTTQEKALGTWLDSICRESVDRMIARADDRGDFLEVA